MHAISTRFPLWLLAWILGPGAGFATAARAQEIPEIVCDGPDDFPCGYQLDALRLRKVPATLKVQARVAQSKLPIGEGLFTTIHVKLLRGNEPLCNELFHDVRVVDSVINLELGRNMDCELDEVMADNSELSFQICPGSATNCMRAIALGATPYAIKSSFASVAGQAHTSNVAGQAHYAHRATADDELWQRTTLANGYFDFATPSIAEMSAIYPNPAMFAPFAHSGFIAWTPIRARGAMDVHVAGKRHGSGQLTELTALTLAADDITARGDLSVLPAPSGHGLTVATRGAHVTGDSDVDGRLAVSRRLKVRADGAHIVGESRIAGTLSVSGATSVAQGGIHVGGDSAVNGTLEVRERLRVTAGGARVVGASDVAGTLIVHAATTVTSGGIAVAGNVGVKGNLGVSAHLEIAAGGLTVAGQGMKLLAGDLVVAADGADVTGDTRLGGRVSATELEIVGSFRATDIGGNSHRAFAMQGMSLAVNPDATLGETVVGGPVTFSGPVIFDGGAVDPRQHETFVHAAGEDRDIQFGGSLTVLDLLSVPGGVTGGLVINGGATVHGALRAPDGISGDLVVAGGLTVAGATTVGGALSLPGGVSGGVSASGALAASGLAISGAAVVNGSSAFPGGVGGPVSFVDGMAIAASGSLLVQGDSTLDDLVVGGATIFGGSARFEAPVVLAAGVEQTTSFANNVTVNGAAVLTGQTHVTGALTVDGATRFNGPVELAGSFSGTTQFQNLTASGTFTVGGLAIFSGKVAFPGGISGNLTLGNVVVATGLGVSGDAAFSGPVDFRGEVRGLDDLAEYLKAVGETRDITLPSLAISGDATLLGTLTLATPIADLAIESLRVDSGATATFGVTTAKDDAVVSDSVAVGGTFSATRCRLCLNYGDNHGAAATDRKYACAKLQHGSNSGQMQLYGDVDSNDVFGLKLICDGGPSGTGINEWR